MSSGLNRPRPTLNASSGQARSVVYTQLTRIGFSRPTPQSSNATRQSCLDHRAAIPKQAEAGVAVPDLCREHGISSATFYKWRARFGGMDASLMARLKELEEENRRLKKMYAEERLKAEIVQEALAKKR